MPLEKFVCINCGEPVDELYKKYSANVLKLTRCEQCNQIADKYVEYDTAIIIIDLILLNREAYRHVLFNMNYSSHWKLWIILQLMEAYSDWCVRSPSFYKEDFDNKKPLILEHFALDDFDYYRTIFKVVIRSMCFFVVICIMSLMYYYVSAKSKKHTKDVLLETWKCMTLSSFGVFLTLPSLIWDKYSAHEYHVAFISLYTTLSQLVAYTVTCRCSKLWSIAVILTSCLVKILCTDYVNTIFK